MGEQSNPGDQPVTESVPAKVATNGAQANREDDRPALDGPDRPISGSGKIIRPEQRPPSQPSSYDKPVPIDPNLKWVLPLVGVVIVLVVAVMASKPRPVAVKGTDQSVAAIAPAQQQPSSEEIAKQAKAALDRDRALEQQNKAKITGVLADIKTVPERLYEVRLSLWDELTKLAPANRNYAAGKQKAAEALASVKEATENPEMRGASIERTAGNKAGFGNVLLVDLTIRNDSLSNLKDFQLRCSTFGNSGSEIGSMSRILYETVEARSSKTFRRFNMGFIDHQAWDFKCFIDRSSIG